MVVQSLRALPVALFLAASGLAAHEPSPVREKIIIKMNHGEGDAAMEKDCEADADKPVDSTGKPMHLKICAKGDPAQVLAQLEAARTKVAAHTSLSDEARNRALSALDGEIAKLKAAQ